MQILQIKMYAYYHAVHTTAVKYAKSTIVWCSRNVARRYSRHDSDRVRVEGQVQQQHPACPSSRDGDLVVSFFWWQWRQRTLLWIYPKRATSIQLIHAMFMRWQRINSMKIMVVENTLTDLNPMLHKRKRLFSPSRRSKIFSGRLLQIRPFSVEWVRSLKEGLRLHPGDFWQNGRFEERRRILLWFCSQHCPASPLRTDACVAVAGRQQAQSKSRAFAVATYVTMQYSTGYCPDVRHWSSARCRQEIGALAACGELVTSMERVCLFRWRSATFYWILFLSLTPSLHLLLSIIESWQKTPAPMSSWHPQHIPRNYWSEWRRNCQSYLLGDFQLFARLLLTGE